MRINKFVALATGISRRAADTAIIEGRVLVNSHAPESGQQIGNEDVVTLDRRIIILPANTMTIILNKPVGYVCSRDGQGSKTVYDLLPTELHNLKTVGRLDKDSSGLLIMTNDGEQAHQLTHPKYQKTKVYEIELNKPLRNEDINQLATGIKLEDGMSHLDLRSLKPGYEVTMTEGRNRQIRRTFQALGYKVTKLHRTHFGPYSLENLEVGTHQYLS